MRQNECLLKVVYLIPSCGITGGIAVACQHTNRLLARGHDVYLVSETQENKINWFPEQKVPILTLDNYPNDVDVLVATGWSTSFTVADLPAKHKFYFVQSDETRFHEPNSIWQHLTALSYLMSYNYFTEAQWIQKWLKDNFDHQAFYIPNGLDQTIFFPDKPLSPKTNRPRILLEGAIDIPYKGMKDAFRVVEDLDVEVWCVSSLGKPKPQWHCDRFFNQVSMTKMRQIYSSCDILLKMSRVEGFFGPPLEMMACGGVVVVGKVTGYDEYIVDGYNALVVDQGDIIAAKAAIQKLISDNELRNKLISNGFKTAEEWDWDSSIDKLESIFKEFVEGERVERSSVVRDMSNRGIVTAFKMAKMQNVNYNKFEATVFSEPIDRIFFKLRKNRFLQFVSKIVFKLYKGFQGFLRIFV